MGVDRGKGLQARQRRRSPGPTSAAGCRGRSPRSSAPGALPGSPGTGRFELSTRLPRSTRAGDLGGLLVWPAHADPRSAWPRTSPQRASPGRVITRCAGSCAGRGNSAAARHMGFPHFVGGAPRPASFPERRPSGRKKSQSQAGRDGLTAIRSAPPLLGGLFPARRLGGSRDLAAGGPDGLSGWANPRRTICPDSAHDAYSARRLPRRSLPGLAEPRPPRQPKRRVCCKDAGAESSRGSTAGGCPDSVRLHAIGPPHALQRRSGALAGQLRGAQRARREDWSARRRRRRGQPHRRDRRGSAVAAAGTFIAAGGGA